MTDEQITTSTRSREVLVERFAVWLRMATGDRTATARAVEGSKASGFSSDTLLLDACWLDEAGEHDRVIVVRLPPSADAWPVFPSYDLGRQVEVMRAVRSGATEALPVPVPEVHWFEPDAVHLGAPFVVMERIEGVAAPDVMPYTWGSWVTELSPADQRALAVASVDVLAGIHAIPVSAALEEALALPDPGDTPLRRHFAHELAYYEWAREGRSFPTIERGFDVLEVRWPAREGASAISWGDARLGNILFVGTTPTAVLDWEMAALAPPGVDLGWTMFFHEHFQRSAQRRGLPGIPGLFEPAAMLARYEVVSGTAIEGFEWYLCYAAVREAAISIRTMGRAVHFGQVPVPEQPEDLILGLDYLVELIDDLDRN